MTEKEMLGIFDKFDARLTAIAEQAKKATERAQQAVAMIEETQQAIASLRTRILATTETIIHPAGRLPTDE